MLDQLPPGQADEFKWRHRVEVRRIRMQLFGQYSRSGAFEWDRAWSLAIVLEQQGVIDTITMRDQRTGRLVRTIIREVARLDPLLGPERAAEVYERVHALSLPEVKQLVREIVKDSRAGIPSR